MQAAGNVLNDTLESEIVLIGALQVFQVVEGLYRLQRSVLKHFDEL